MTAMVKYTCVLNINLKLLNAISVAILSHSYLTLSKFSNLKKPNFHGRILVNGTLTRLRDTAAYMANCCAIILHGNQPGKNLIPFGRALFENQFDL